MAVTFCMNCRSRDVFTRGNCSNCYQRHRYKVVTGKTTWDALVASGAIAPKHARQPAVCEVDGCEKNVIAKRLCPTHYQSMRRARITEGTWVGHSAAESVAGQ